MGHLFAITVSIADLSVSVFRLIENSHTVPVYAVLIVQAHLRGVTAGRAIEAYHFSILAGLTIIQKLHSLKLGSNSTSWRTNIWIAFLLILFLAPNLLDNLLQFFIHAERFLRLFLLL